MQKITCSSCSANEFTKLPNGFLRCNYCGTIFLPSFNTIEEEKNIFKIYRSSKVSGTHCKNLRFAVHKHLRVTGMHNTIVCHSSLENVQHVSTLKITGKHCTVDVVMVDNSTCSDSGKHNEFRNF